MHATLTQHGGAVDGDSKPLKHKVKLKLFQNNDADVVMFFSTDVASSSSSFHVVHSFLEFRKTFSCPPVSSCQVSDLPKI